MILSQIDLKTYHCDLDDITGLSKEVLSKALCRFLTEVKKIDGTDFPGKTLYKIVICLQFWLETKGSSWRLISDNEFTELKYTLDNLMKECASAGIGITVRKAEALSVGEEEVLWCSGVLGMENPQILLDTIVYLVGLHCALRAGKEHRSLRSIPFDSQFQYKTDILGIQYITYTEDYGLKTNKGGLKHRKIDPKVVDIYPVPNKERCPVAIFSKYLSLLPRYRTCKSLYLQPKRKFSDQC